LIGVADRPDAGRALREDDPTAADRMVGRPEQVGAREPAVAAGWDERADLKKDPAVVPDPASVEVPAQLRAEIESHIAKYPDRRSAALPALWAAQRLHGWCSPEALEQVAAVMQVTPAYLSSLTSFYDMLNTEPVGPHQVYVCTSVACNLRNAQALLEALEGAGGGYDEINIRGYECLGACDLAPMASIDGRYVGPIDPREAAQVINDVRSGRLPLRGRGLGDPGFRLPWEERPRAQPGAGSEPLEAEEAG
jgi:NADH-quinone oxidoreductase subunit E